LPALTDESDLVRFHARVVLHDWAFGQPDPGFPLDRAIQRPIPKKIRDRFIEVLRTTSANTPRDLVLRAMLGEKIAVAEVRRRFDRRNFYFALRVLAEIPTPAAGRELRRILQSSRRRPVRHWAAIFLARRNDPFGISILRRSAAGPLAGLHADSVLEAQVALLRLGDAQAAREIRRRLRTATDRDLYVLHGAFRSAFRERMPHRTWKADARRLIRGVLNSTEQR
jgi:hypothetical protein